MMKIGILIPAYDEEITVSNLISEIPSSINGIDTLIIAIDDGSTDNTYLELKKANVDHIIRHEQNQGLGASFNNGVKKAIELDVDYLINLDADGQHSPSYLPKFVDLLHEQGCDFVLGSRFIDSKDLEMPYVKKIGNYFFSYLLSFLLKTHITDVTSGYRGYSKNIFPHLLVNTSFSYTIESMLTIFQNNADIKYCEFPIIVSSRDGKSRVVKNWMDYGIRSIAIILRTLYSFYIHKT